MKYTKVLAVLLAAFLAMALSACGGSKSETSSRPTVPTYRVSIHVECDSNLVFSRYDVSVFFDGTKLGSLLTAKQPTIPRRQLKASTKSSSDLRTTARPPAPPRWRSMATAHSPTPSTAPPIRWKLRKSSRGSLETPPRAQRQNLPNPSRLRLPKRTNPRRSARRPTSPRF